MNKNIRLNFNQMLIISFGFALFILISSLLTFSFSVLLLQIILGAITLFFCLRTDYKTAKLWLSIFVISIMFVFLVYLANQCYFGEPYYNGGSDDLKFEQWGYDVYNFGAFNPSEIMKHNVIGQFHNSPFFPVFIARLIQFSVLFDGYTTFLPRISNVYFLLWISMITKYLLENYTKLSQNEIYYSIAFFALMPNIQYINSHVFRDTFNLLQILLIALLFDLMLKRKKYFLKIGSIVFYPFLLYSTYYTRINSILFAGILILMMVSSKYRIKVRYIVITLIPLILLSNLFDIFRIDYYIEIYSNYLSNISAEGLSRFVFNIPIFPFGILLRAIYALASPFPNFFSLFKEPSKLLFDLILLLIYFGVMVQVMLIPFIIKRILKFDWLALVFLSYFLAVIFSTFTFRHVLLYYPFLAALAIDGYSESNLGIRNLMISISSFIMLCFGVIYAVYKIF